MKTTKYYQIGQVSKAVGLPASTIRFWEKTFSGLKTIRSSGGHRYYSGDQVELITLLKKLLHEEGYTIEGAKKYLAAKKNRVQSNPADAQSGEAHPGHTLSHARNTDSDKNSNLLFHIKTELTEILNILKQTSR